VFSVAFFSRGQSRTIASFIQFAHCPASVSCSLLESLIRDSSVHESGRLITSRWQQPNPLAYTCNVISRHNYSYSTRILANSHKYSVQFWSIYFQWRSQKLCVGRESRGACAEWGGVWGEVSPPQPTRGSGEASWAPAVWSGAKPRPQIHFLHILSHRTLLVERRMWLWYSRPMNYGCNNSFCRCPVLATPLSITTKITLQIYFEDCMRSI